MVRSLSQWTKTLSFPSRMSPNRNSKECNVNVHPVTTSTTNNNTNHLRSSSPPPPTPPRKDKPQNQSMTSSAGSSSPSPPPNVPITEISQIVSCEQCLCLGIIGTEIADSIEVGLHSQVDKYLGYFCTCELKVCSYWVGDQITDHLHSSYHLRSRF